MDLLWVAINQLVHRGKRCDVRELAHRVHRLSWEHKAGWQNQLQPDRLKTWKHPPANIIKVKVDVAIRESYAGIVVIA